MDNVWFALVGLAIPPAWIAITYGRCAEHRVDKQTLKDVSCLPSHNDSGCNTQDFIWSNSREVVSILLGLSIVLRLLKFAQTGTGG